MWFCKTHWRRKEAGRFGIFSENEERRARGETDPDMMEKKGD